MMKRRTLCSKLPSIVAGTTLALTLGVAGSASAKDLRILASVPSLGFPFFVHMLKEVKAEAAAMGGIEVIESDGQNSTPKQSGDVEAAIAQGVDGIVISPLDAVAMAPALEEAVAAGIPVVTIDRSIQGVDGILAHVGADNVKGGEAQGEWVMARYPDGARIINLQGQPGSSPAIDRNKGLHNALDGNAKYAFVAEQTAEFAREKGANVTESLLAGMDTPPDVIVAANDDMALGAMQVIDEMGLIGKVAVVGFDALPEALGQVRDGGLSATVEQSPGAQSRGAVRALVGFLRDGTQPEAVTLLAPFVVTRDNIDTAERLSEVQ